MAAPKIKLGITKSSFDQHAQRYMETKAMADEAAARLKKQRDGIIAFLAKNGIEDDKGNTWLQLKDGSTRFKRERRVSNVFDAEAALEWLEGHGGDLWEECTTQITVVDEDALLGKIYAELIPEDVAESWYTEKESFALKFEEL